MLVKTMEGQNLGAFSEDFPDLKVAVEETKVEADARGAVAFALKLRFCKKTHLNRTELFKNYDF
jgi:hypothetical protein